MTILRSGLMLCAALAALVVAVLFGMRPAEAQQGNYIIRPGDTLRFEVLEDESLNRSLLVLPDGRVSVPLAGTVIAAGRTVEQVRRAMASALATSFSVPPTVYVAVGSLAERPPQREPEPEIISVYVLGEAANPGKIDMEPGATVLQLFSRMGGFTNFAAIKRIQLRRTDPHSKTETIYRLNYKAIQDGVSRNGLTPLQDGDVIMVPQRRLFE